MSGQLQIVYLFIGLPWSSVLLKHAVNINQIAERGQNFQVWASDMFRLVCAMLGYCKPKNTFQDLQNQEKLTMETGILTLQYRTLITE